jgi:hypothetical protein
MDQSTSAGATTVAFDGELLAVDKALWTGGRIWNAVSKLYELQASARQKLFLGSDVRAWIAFMAHPGQSAKVWDWLVDLSETAPQLEDRNRMIGIIATSEPRVYQLSGWYSLVRIESVPFAEGGAHEAVLGAMLAGAKAPMALALVARRSAWVGAGIDYVKVATGDLGSIHFDLRLTEQKIGM